MDTEQQRNETIYAKHKHFFKYADKIVENFYNKNRQVYNALGFGVKDLKQHIFIKLFENIKEYTDDSEFNKRFFINLTKGYLKRLIKQNFRKTKNYEKDDDEKEYLASLTEEERLLECKTKNRVFLGWVLFDDLTPEKLAKLEDEKAQEELDKLNMEDIKYAIESSKLTDKDKNILILTIVYGYNAKEVGKRLSVSRQYIYKRLEKNKPFIKELINYKM